MSRDNTEQNIKRANEKAKKWKTLDYKNTKSRNLYNVPIELEKVPCCDDETFEMVAANRFRKRY